MREAGRGEDREVAEGQKRDMMEGANDDGQRVKPQKQY